MTNPLNISNETKNIGEITQPPQNTSDSNQPNHYYVGISIAANIFHSGRRDVGIRRLARLC